MHSSAEVIGFIMLLQCQSFFVILVQHVAEKIQNPSMGCSNFWDLAVGFVFNA